MSLRETYSLAHTAQCKLQLSVDRPDRNLRFMVGHAMHLDSLMLRIVEIEESVQQSQHASSIKFKGTGGSNALPKHASAARRSPPPRATELDSDSDDEDVCDYAEDDEEDDLSLTRFPSGSAAPPRHPQATPQLIPSDGDSSSSDEDDDGMSGQDPESLRDLINNNSEGDQFLAELYNGVKKCPCHKSDAPAIERAWELPGEDGGKRRVMVEIAA